jgi:hypothetical protein
LPLRIYFVAILPKLSVFYYINIPGQGIENFQKPPFTHSPASFEAGSFPFPNKIRNLLGPWVKEL